MSTVDRYQHVVYGTKHDSDPGVGLAKLRMSVKTMKATCSHDEAMAQAAELRADGWKVSTIGCGCPQPEPAVDRVAEIRTRLNAATPGPWEVDVENDDGFHQITITAGGTIPCGCEPSCTSEFYRSGEVELTQGDVELFANAPADLAWLLDQLKEMQARAAAAEGAEMRHFARARDFYMDAYRLREQLEAFEARAAAAEARVQRYQAAIAFGDLVEREQGPTHQPGCGRCGNDCWRCDAGIDSDEQLGLVDLKARFPETDEHRRITDQAAARLLGDDE